MEVKGESIGADKVVKRRIMWFEQEGTSARAGPTPSEQIQPATEVRPAKRKAEDAAKDGAKKVRSSSQCFGGSWCRQDLNLWALSVCRIAFSSCKLNKTVHGAAPRARCVSAGSSRRPVYCVQAKPNEGAAVAQAAESGGGVTEQEIVEFLRASGPIASSQLTARFKRQIKTSEHKTSFTKLVKKVAKLEEVPPGSGNRCIVLKH